MLVTEKEELAIRKQHCWGGGGRLDGKTLGEGFAQDSIKGKVSQPFWRLLSELENTALQLGKRLCGNVRNINDCT